MSHEKLLGKQILEPHLRPTESEILGKGSIQQSVSTSPSGDYAANLRTTALHAQKVFVFPRNLFCLFINSCPYLCSFWLSAVHALSHLVVTYGDNGTTGSKRSNTQDRPTVKWQSQDVNPAGALIITMM